MKPKLVLVDHHEPLINRWRKQMAEEAEKRQFEDLQKEIDEINRAHAEAVIKTAEAANAWTFPIPQGWTVDPDIAKTYQRDYGAGTIPICDHERINVGFWHEKWVCKKCDVDL